MQPIPKVSNDDVERIVRRDYPQNLYFTIMDVLEEYGSERWQREEHRVRLAVLKLANGDIDELRRLIITAKKDYRDVIAPAEYPSYSKNRWGTEEKYSDIIQKIIQKDWEQYTNWLWKD